MAFRVGSRRIVSSALHTRRRTCSESYTFQASGHNHTFRANCKPASPVGARWASTEPGVSASNLSEHLKSDISKEAALPNPDPSSDSSTAAFLGETTPYMVPTYVRPPPAIVKGEGSYVWDMENRRYLDFTAGIAVNALGHADPEMCNLIAHQARLLIHASNLYHNPWTPALSKLLIAQTQAAIPGTPLSQVFISNSGTEANEAALKFARKVAYNRDPKSQQREILSFHDSFHGRTYGALSATPNPKYQTPFGPMVPGFKYGKYNDVESLRSLITDKTCAVIVEPIQGEGGINVATSEFLQALRSHCDRVGALLIFDEIQCGLSRTGKLWAHANYGVHPDILTSAKALGNGIPIGATLISGVSVAPHIKTGDHGTTFGGSPFACRIAHYVFSRLADPELQASVEEKSRIFLSAFEDFLRKYPGVFSDIRGKGLILGLQLSEGAKDKATEIVTAARERGLLVITAGNGALRFVPPLTISKSEIQEGLQILDSALKVVFSTPEEVTGTKGQQEMAGR